MEIFTALESLLVSHTPYQRLFQMLMNVLYLPKFSRRPLLSTANTGNQTKVDEIETLPWSISLTLRLPRHHSLVKSILSHTQFSLLQILKQPYGRSGDGRHSLLPNIQWQQWDSEPIHTSRGIRESIIWVPPVDCWGRC